MSLTLNEQMNIVIQNGLRIISKHRQAILNEWESILFHLRKAGKRSEKNAEATIRFFSEYLFNLDNEATALHKAIDYTWEQKPASFQTNQFIITLLENAIHKVIQADEKQNLQDHQAVQYLFSIISEHILTHPYNEQFSIDTFLKQLVSSRQLPIEWAAIVIKKDQAFLVEKWFNYMNHDLLLGNDSMKAESIYSLSELLLGQMPKEERINRNVVPIPYDDGTLLVCTNHHDTTHIIPFLTYALEIFQRGKDTLKITKQEQQWKDSVIMFNETIMSSRSFAEAIENITAGFVNYLPFERCALFSYSINDQMGFGLFGHRLDNKAIQNITEDIGNLPLIQSNLQTLELFGENMDYLQPLYIKDASHGFPNQYVEQFRLKTVVVAPIFTSSNNKLLGAAILDQGPEKYFKVTEETFSALIKFGKSAGEILSRFYLDKPEQNKLASLHLSPREIDVLKLMADGASTNEAASTLHLSEYTVRDYVSAIMQKMGARNRTEAVARAIREGLI
ncbi:response regulator transcription factor [Virgibacillus dakarensis]|nr:response regulator transcription factor [Virgibacillus dakarensis]